MKLEITFPYPKVSWEEAYEWCKERGILKSSKSGILTNPNHWDRENMIKIDRLLKETTYTWIFDYE